MAINKNDYLDVDGNYDLKKSLVDELIDEVNSSATTEIDTPTDVLSGFDLSAFRVTKRNNVVTIFGRIQGSITPSFQKFCTLGTGFRPPVLIIVAGWANFATNNLSQIQVSANGDMYIRSQDNATTTDVSISYTV